MHLTLLKGILLHLNRLQSIFAFLNFVNLAFELLNVDFYFFKENYRQIVDHLLKFLCMHLLTPFCLRTTCNVI